MASKKWTKVLERVATTRVQGSEQELGELAMRTGMGVACDPDHPNFGPMNRFYVEMLAGKATQAIEVQGTMPMSLAFTPEVAKMMGIESLEARVVDDNGDDVEVSLGGDV